jgi:REP element-mobilizing transposase RayT
MHGAHSELYLHVVWCTWRRKPFITFHIRQPIYGAIAHQCATVGADVIAIGGMEDHVHVFVRLPVTISVAEFVRRIKGASAHLVTQVIRPSEPFKWQGGYSAFTVSPRHVNAVRRYVLNQEEHHRERTANPAMEPGDFRRPPT